MDTTSANGDVRRINQIPDCGQPMALSTALNQDLLPTAEPDI
jgi:hypothetical protein